MGDDLLQKFQGGKRVSARQIARASLEPPQDITMNDEASDKLGALPNTPKSSSRIPQKRLSEPPRSMVDTPLAEESAEFGKASKRRRLSLSDSRVEARPMLPKEGSTAPPDSEVSITIQSKAPQPSALLEASVDCNPEAAVEQTETQSSVQPDTTSNEEQAPPTDFAQDREMKKNEGSSQHQHPAEDIANMDAASGINIEDTTQTSSATDNNNCQDGGMEVDNSKEKPSEQISDSPSSPISSPPSSPTLNAQAKTFDVPAAKDSTATTELSEPTHTSKESVEAVDLDKSQPTDLNLSPNEGNVNSEDVPMEGTQEIVVLKTPSRKKTQTRKPPVQLPTPPSSNGSASDTADSTLSMTGSGRAVKKPQRFGEPDQTPATPEDMGDSYVLGEEDVDFKPPASMKAKTGAKTQRGAMINLLAGKEAPAKSSAQVKKGGANKISLTKQSVPKAQATPKPAKAGKSTAAQKKAASNAAKTPTAPKGKKKGDPKDEPTIAILANNRVNKIEVDKRKQGLSELMAWRDPVDVKPEPVGSPRVWAESRQALCETLPYFKKPQGGCYSNEGHVYGFLFDGVGHCREYLDTDLILCRAGGSMEADSSTGGMAQKKDQHMSESQVQSIINDMKHRNPVIVICGSKNIASPTKMPHQYNVLGWFKPVYVWAEKTQGKGNKVWTTIKYRLERLNQHVEPAWFAPQDDSLRVSDENKAIAGPLVSKSCEYCEKSFPQIYLQGWWCLNPACDAFWEIDGDPAPCAKGELDYDPAFLLHRHEQWKTKDQEREPVPTDIRPAIPKSGELIGDNLYHINTRGICCPQCGRCNSRRKFTGWKCENPACDWEHIPKHKQVLPSMLHTPWDAAPTLVRNRVAEGVEVESMHLHGYKVSRYTFKDINGCFVHIAAPKELLSEHNGPNEMFERLQIEDMGLERRVFAVSKMSGGRSDKPKVNQPDSATQEDAAPAEDNTEESTEEFAAGDLMTAFSMNYGMPYKFVASGGSQSFEGAPWPVSECRRRLNWAQKTFLDNEHEYMDFNEQLIFAYLEGQKIEYHDDGESGLGPRIATLSLGGKAKMHLRMKAKHYVGCSKVGVFTEERPVPGGIDGPDMDKKKLEKWEELQTLKADSVAYNKRRKEIPKELGIFEKRTKKASDLVTVTLNHGDMIVMDGYDIQKYLEHKVVPEGHLRFALTCRTVLPDHLKPEELPSYAVEEDAVTYNGPSVELLNGQLGMSDS